MSSFVKPTIEAGIPHKIARFLATNFNKMGGNREYNWKNFSNAAFDRFTVSMSLVQHDTETNKNTLYAAAVLQFFNDQAGAYISYFMVSPEHRRRLWGFSFVENIRSVFPVLRLQCFNDNTIGNAFWKHCGFRNVCKKEEVTHYVWKARS